MNDIALMEPGSVKESLLEAIYEEVESELIPLGCTGMEDRLQEHVGVFRDSWDRRLRL